MRQLACFALGFAAAACGARSNVELGYPPGFDAGLNQDTFDAGTSNIPDAGPAAGDTAYICVACQSSADCGGGGNQCLQFGSEGMFCGSACTGSSQCPSGDFCNIASGTGGFCIPESEQCPGVIDAGTRDAGTEDAGTRDAGITVVDAGPPDAGTTVIDAGPPPCTTETWSNFAQNFFDTSCDTCHGHDFGSSVSAVQAEQSTIVSYITSGKMPQGTTLNATTKANILKWLSCGDPQ